MPIAQASPQSMLPSSMISESWSPMDSEIQQMRQQKITTVMLEEWARILNINLRGTFVCMKTETARMLSQGGGVIVNTSAGAGIRGVAGGASYAASKHAI